MIETKKVFHLGEDTIVLLAFHTAGASPIPRILPKDTKTPNAVMLFGLRSPNDTYAAICRAVSTVICSKPWILWHIGDNLVWWKHTWSRAISIVQQAKAHKQTGEMFVSCQYLRCFWLCFDHLFPHSISGVQMLSLCLSKEKR